MAADGLHDDPRREGEQHGARRDAQATCRGLDQRRERAPADDRQRRVHAVRGCHAQCRRCADAHGRPSRESHEVGRDRTDR